MRWYEWLFDAAYIVTLFFGGIYVISLATNM